MTLRKLQAGVDYSAYDYMCSPLLETQVMNLEIDILFKWEKLEIIF